MPSTGRFWKIYTFAGIALWVGAIFLVASRYEPRDQAGPVRLTTAVGGAIFFGGIFVGAYVQLRRSSRHQVNELYERLAVAPVPSGTAAPAGTMGRIGRAYLVFGVLVTAGGLVAIGLNDDGIGRWILWGVVAIAIVWVLYLVLYAWWAAFRAAEDAVAPLGLRLTSQPSYVPDAGSGGGQLVGPIVYEGRRHGRAVRIEQTTKQAITWVELSPVAGAPAGWSVPVALPRSADEMAVLTGEAARSWRRVTVEGAAGAVVVRRRTNGAAGWMLQDLLLAESVAAADRGSAPPPPP